MNTNNRMISLGLDKETCIINLSKEDKENSEQLPSSPSYSFITQCFFLAHRALQLGVHGLLNKFYRLGRDVAGMQELYIDAVNGFLPTYQADEIKHRFISGRFINVLFAFDYIT